MKWLYEEEMFLHRYLDMFRYNGWILKTENNYFWPWEHPKMIKSDLSKKKYVNQMGLLQFTPWLLLQQSFIL